MSSNIKSMHGLHKESNIDGVFSPPTPYQLTHNCFYYLLYLEQYSLFQSTPQGHQASQITFHLSSQIWWRHYISHTLFLLESSPKH